VKEADSLVNAGYEVVVIYQYWNDWGTILDQKLLSAKKWQSYQVGGSPTQQKLIYWFSRLQHKLANIFTQRFGFKSTIAEMSVGRCTFLLANKARSIKADLYIGHNLAALPAVVNAAKYNNSKCGFDAEDLHRFETTIDYDIKLKAYLEDKYFNKVDYLTTSSPKIAKKYNELFPNLTFHSILNVFPKSGQAPSFNNTQPIKLFWFSQHVGLSRGLQDVIRSLSILDGQPIEFHVLGFLSTESNDSLNELIKSLKFVHPPKISFYQPIAPSKIIDFATQFNIGLATEPGFSINNYLALSNKLFTYLKAGLAVVATETIAQKAFLKEHPSIGLSYEIGSAKQLANLLSGYLKDPGLLTQHQKGAYQLYDTQLNWDRESIKFLTIINKILH
jgi:glycosyltransferase involved in cell wall biosynthesis